jgi:hypothetical protein
VVKVDMGHGDTGQVISADTVLAQGGQYYGERTLAPDFNENGRPALYEVAGGDSFPTAQQCVELPHAGRDITAHGGRL